MMPGVAHHGLRQRIRLPHGNAWHPDGKNGDPVFVHMQEPCGNDELALEGVDTQAAMHLLARLVRPAAFDHNGNADELLREMPAADRDAILAALHRRCWGDRIVSTIRCEHCGAQFDLSFALSAMQASLYQQGRQWLQEHLAQQEALLPVPPSGAQELAAAELLHANRPDDARQLLTGDSENPVGLAQILEHAAPILDLELDAQCPECSHAQQAHFDLQSFVLQRLLNERALLLQEVHTLARGYRWALGDILALPRSQRRSFVEMLANSAA